MKLRALLLLVWMLPAACSSSDDEGGKKPITLPEPKLVFRPAQASGASITMRAASLENGKLVIELVANDLADLYGVAFRVVHDPQKLAFTSFAAGPVFAGPDLITMADGKSPGRVAAVVTLKGRKTGVAADGAVVGVLTYSLLQAQPTKLEFVTSRSGAIAALGGNAIPAVTWAGGELVLE